MVDPSGTARRVHSLLRQYAHFPNTFYEDGRTIAVRSLRSRLLSLLSTTSEPTETAPTLLDVALGDLSCEQGPTEPADEVIAGGGHVLNGKYIKHAMKLADEALKERNLDDPFAVDLYLCSVHYLLSALQPSANARIHAQLALVVHRARMSSETTILPREALAFPSSAPAFTVGNDQNRVSGVERSQPPVSQDSVLWANCDCGRRVAVDAPEDALYGSNTRRPRSLGDLFITGLVFVALYIKHSPMPRLIALLLHSLFTSLLALDERFHLRQTLLLMCAAALERAVELDREFGLHRWAADAAGWAFEAFVSVLVALMRAEASGTLPRDEEGIGKTRMDTVTE